MIDEINKLIRHPQNYSSAGLNRPKPDLRLWHSAAFEPHIVWSLHPDLGSVPKGKEPLSGYILRRLIISEGETTPRVFGTEARPTQKAIGRIFNQLYAIQLSPFAPQTEIMQRDGETFGIAWGNAPDYVEFSWWNNLPESWAKLAAWHQTTVAYFDSILPEP